MVFQSSKNIYTVVLLWITVLFILIAPFLPADNELETPKELIFGIAILYTIAILIIWILLDTKYTINGKNLRYASGPIRGKINIEKITALENVTTWYVTSFIKPALGYYGFTVRYEKFNDIYISPKDKEKFIEEILKINPNVMIR